MTDDTVVNTLNELIGVCKDNEESLRDAMELIESAGLQALFAELVTEWQQIALAFHTEVIHQNGTPNDQGTIVGSAFRWLGKLRATLSNDERAAIRGELEQISDRALARFDSALARPLPEEVKSIIQLQRNRVVEAHDRMHRLT